MNILVTGSNGLIGYELVRKLKDENKVFALSRAHEGVIDGVEYIRFNLLDQKSYNSLPKKIDVIYHLAQSEHFRDFPDKSLEIFNVNTTSTLLLLEYARKAECSKFIYASSGGVYGNAEKEFVEDNPLVNTGNLGFYLGTKFCSELLVGNYTPWYNVIIARFFFVYGERQNKGMLIPRLLANIINGNEITLQGNNGIKINPIYVSDAANALCKMISLAKGNYIFNIGGEEVLTLREICDIIGQIVNKKPKFNILDQNPKHLIGDISKMKELLSVPVIDFRTGINYLVSKITPMGLKENLELN